MTRKIAMISGKGGSGKTSFSLAFAKALSDMGLNVLLVDCDMCTHGATFFMKPWIEKHKKAGNPIISVDSILLERTMPVYGFFSNNIGKQSEISSGANLNAPESLIHVEQGFYFLPSDISISNSKNSNQRYFFSFFCECINTELAEMMDIIIYDCQAGFSEFTRHLVRNSDAALLVTEPDSVSAAANRALCFQMGIELESTSAFQIFNKITETEADAYTKVATSAFFSNLSPVIFNWKVRKTFVRFEIPCANSVNEDFAFRIADALYMILPEYRSKIDIFKEKLLEDNYNRLNYLKSVLLRKEQTETRIRRLRLIEDILLVFSLILMLTTHIFNNLISSIAMFMVVIVLATIFLLRTSTIRDQEDDNMEALGAVENEYREVVALFNQNYHINPPVINELEDT